MEYVRAIRRHWLVGLLVLFAVMVPTVLVNLLAPPQFVASTRLWVGVAGGEGITDLSQKVSVAGDLMSTYPELVRSPMVLDPVVAKLRLPTDAAALAERIDASVPNGTLVLDIAVTDESPARAADIANAVADQFSTVVGALPQVRTRSAGAVDTTVIQVALPPPDPSSPRVARNVAIGLVLGLVLAAIVCLVVERYFPKKQGDGRPPSTDAVAT